MKNFHAFPIWDGISKKLVDGTLFQVPSVCSKVKQRKCLNHYDAVRNVKGFHICPAGLTTYSSGGAEPLIFSGVKINNFYDVGKTKRYSDFLPTIPPQVFLTSINRAQSLSKSPRGTEKLDSHMIDFSIHEVRRFNAEIKRISEEILLDRSGDVSHLQKRVKSIFASSSLISVRLNAFDLEENPDVITSQSTFNSGVFKKFQKASHCLDTYARDRSVRIQSFQGTSHLSIDMYQIFDLIPFVILENAIKYSPQNQNVRVQFEEVNARYLKVTISSIGPCNTEEEMSRIFDKKSRGHQAALVDGTGGGYGLYFAKLICDMHDIKIHAKSGGCNFELNGCQYGEFTIVLEIQR